MPGKICRRFIVTRRGIIIKAVVHVRIYVSRVFFIVGL